MTARDNAETADLTLEVGRLRGELEALKLEHLGCKPLHSRRKLETRLTEAAALLERIKRWNDSYAGDGEDWGTLEVALNDHLSRAPAQPAAPTPACGCCWCHDGHPEQCCGQPAAPTPEPGSDYVMLDVTADPYGAEQPAAPEPSAEKCLDLAEAFQRENEEMKAILATSHHANCLAMGNALLARAESAEAQLAAVRRFERRIRDDEYLVVDDDGERLLADVLLALLTPAPSPGAGEKT